jgi:hypothetical protein
MDGGLIPVKVDELSYLGQRVNALHGEIKTHLRQAIINAMDAGDILLDVREKVGYGNFGAWREEHCVIPDSTARLCMQLAKNRPKLEDRFANALANLSLRQARAFLSDERRLDRDDYSAAGAKHDELSQLASSHNMTAEQLLETTKAVNVINKRCSMSERRRQLEEWEQVEIAEEDTIAGLREYIAELERELEQYRTPTDPLQ